MPFEATPLYVAKAALFRTLGHPARVRILELLRDGEHSVGALQEALGLDSGGTSQHLARSAPHRSRRVAQGGHERLLPRTDPQVFALLDAGRALIARYRRRSSRRCSRSSRRSDRVSSSAASSRSPPAACSAPWCGTACVSASGSRRGRARLGVAGLLGSRRRRQLGLVASRATLTPRAGIDGLTGALPRHARARRLSRRSCTRRVCAPHAARPRHGAAHCRVPARARRGALRARRALVPLLLGADDARSGGDHPRRQLATGERAAHGLHLRRDHALGGAGVPGSRCSCSPTRERSATQRRSTDGSGVQAVIAVAAIIGFGTKAGLMPMHAWLPRAHPIAPAYHLGADERRHGHGRRLRPRPRARRLARPGPLLGRGARCSSLGGLSALGGIIYALFQRELKRLLAYSTVEHLGIVALGLGACLLLRRHGADEWAAFALGAALLHTVNHAAFKALLFLGAGMFERATGALELDRLGGLLRRLPWSGGAFLVGALAIAGIAAAERLRVRVADAPGAPPCPRLRGRLGRHARSARAGGARGDDGARRSLLRQGDRPRPARPAAPAGSARRPSSRRADALRARASSPAPASFSAPLPGSSSRGSVGLAPWADGDRAPVRPGLELPGTGNLPTVGIAVVLFVSRRTARGSARGSRRAAPRPTWAVGQPLEPALLWTSAGFTQAAAARARSRPPTRAGDRDDDTRRRRAGGVVQPGACRI